jgi:FAD/FMN-containing dehydrogenase
LKDQIMARFSDLMSKERPAPGRHSKKILHLFGGAALDGFDAVVVLTGSDDVAEILAEAASRQVQVTLYGGCHSWAVPAERSGLLIFNAHSTEQVRLDIVGPNVVSVRGSLTWRALEASLNAAGYMVPVLTTELETTIGGTIAAGGYGERSLHRGGQLDLVQRMVIVLPDGTRKSCSASENADLFRLVGGSHGAVGIIEQVDLTVEPYAPHTQVGIREYDTLGSMVHDICEIMCSPFVESIDSLRGQHYRGRFICTCAADSPDRLDASRSKIPKWNTDGRNFSALDWHRRGLFERRQFDTGLRYLWNDFVIPVNHAEEFAKVLDELALSMGIYAKYRGRLLILALSNQRADRTTFWFSPVPWHHSGLVGFGLYFELGVEADYSEYQWLSEVQGELSDIAVSVGGLPYLAGTPIQTPKLIPEKYRAGVSRLHSDLGLGSRRRLNLHALQHAASGLK